MLFPLPAGEGQGEGARGIFDTLDYDFGFPKKSSLDLTELFPFDE